MIDDLTPYPAYKDSGQPWLGKVPGHWDLNPNRGLVKKRKVLVGKRHKDYQLLSLTKQGVIVRDISTKKGKFSSDMGTSQEGRVGDFVFCLFDVPETPRAVGLSRHAGMITGAYTVLESLARGNPGYFEKGVTGLPLCCNAICKRVLRPMSRWRGSLPGVDMSNRGRCPTPQEAPS
ncbi:MAG: hypothetical protein K2X38_18585 [Gemmataceae bacterium]|nr:hypothetical protein [Gemmataceae bacterium]